MVDEEMIGDRFVLFSDKLDEKMRRCVAAV